VVTREPTRLAPKPGGFSDETHIFKALTMNAPNFKAVCMGRALMIPGMVGKKWGGEVRQGRQKLPLGAVGIYTARRKIRTGLQQLVTGSRNFNLSTITRRDLVEQGRGLGHVRS